MAAAKDKNKGYHYFNCSLFEFANRQQLLGVLIDNNKHKILVLRTLCNQQERSESKGIIEYRHRIYEGNKQQPCRLSPSGTMLQSFLPGPGHHGVFLEGESHGVSYNCYF